MYLHMHKPFVGVKGKVDRSILRSLRYDRVTHRRFVFYEVLRQFILRSRVG